MKKIVVFYYSQTGQAQQIAQNVCKPLAEAGYQVVYKCIEPVTPFPFPWSYWNFFQAFPETRLLMPAPIKEFDLSDVQDADLVFLAGQSWYLSPSQPIEAFLTSPQVRTYLKNRPVVTINGCRNMWAMAQKEVRKQLVSMEARYVGHIVLQDYAPNLISVVTIFRWLFRQQKAATRIWPAAGVSDADMAGASCFGKLIQSALEQNDLEQLQSALVAAGSVPYKPSLVFVEKTGHRIFGFWAKFIRKAGDRNSPDRRFRLRLFVYYLFFVLYVVSPFGLLFFYLTYPLRMAGIRKEKADLLLNLKE